MIENLTEEQKRIVTEYQSIFAKLSLLEKRMDDLQSEAAQLMGQLEQLREKDKKIFENYGKR